jgi:hypothetical protein
MSVTTPAMPADRTDPVAFVRYLDLVLLAMAAPFALLLGAPVLGFAVGLVAYTLQRLGGTYLERRARSATSARAAVGLQLGSSLGRAWITGLAIVAVGIAGARADGLTAAITVIAAYTVYFAITLIFGRRGL